MEKQGQANASVEAEREYQKNVDLSIQWSRWLLKLLGVWPMFNKSTRMAKCISCLINIACVCMISFLFVPCAIFFLVEVKDLYNKIRLIGPLSFFVMSYMKYYLLVLHGDDIRECVERIKRDWRSTRYIEDRNVMVVYAKYGRELIAICTFIVYCSFTFFYLIIPLTAGRTVVEGENLTFISLAFPFTKLIVDTRYSPANEIVYSIQIFTGFVVNLITPAACSLAIVFAVHACGQMQILMNWLEHLVHGRSDMSNVVDDRIASTVNQHVRILKYDNCIKGILKELPSITILRRSVNATHVTMEQDYLRNVNLSIQWNRWLLTPLDVWPNARKNSRARRCLSWLIGVVCYCLISFEFVSCLMFVVAEQENVKGKIRLVGPLIFFAMTFVKYFLLTFHVDDIRECIERIEWDWKHARHLEDRNVMIAYANYGTKLASVCTFFVYCSFAFYYLIRPISMGRTVVEEENLTFIPMAFPFPKLIADVRYSPANEIVYSVQVLTGVLIHLITAAACSLAAVFALHACGQMKVLTIWLEHLVDGRSDVSDTVDERIASIVGQHVRILKFLALTEKALQQISFVEFVGCTVVLCLIGYYIIMCVKIGEATYMINWYQLSGNKKLCCILFIAMSNSSIKFTAGNMVELSINTFSNVSNELPFRLASRINERLSHEQVVKTSMAFFNMLRAMM
ncbi:unnamed protein product [Xylocopa violacea]|uniref:Odorant receptor n=1 Tax=Xylocopa violacea TaxID=135666 RepID=A0ABP1N879_XYLVO